ncbi:uncharacterized protein MONBRDRAFT_38756, partial [Monosiga brevicollis MX1]
MEEDLDFLNYPPPAPPTDDEGEALQAPRKNSGPDEDTDAILENIILPPPILPVHHGSSDPQPLPNGSSELSTPPARSPRPLQEDVRSSRGSALPPPSLAGSSPLQHSPAPSRPSRSSPLLRGQRIAVGPLPDSVSSLSVPRDLAGLSQPTSPTSPSVRSLQGIALPDSVPAQELANLYNELMAKAEQLEQLFRQPPPDYRATSLMQVSHSYEDEEEVDDTTSTLNATAESPTPLATTASRSQSNKPSGSQRPDPTTPGSVRPRASVHWSEDVLDNESPVHNASTNRTAAHAGLGTPLSPLQDPPSVHISDSPPSKQDSTGRAHREDSLGSLDNDSVIIRDDEPTWTNIDFSSTSSSPAAAKKFQ